MGGASIRFLGTAMVLLSLASTAKADVTLLMSDEMLAAGFDKQLLPRFKFKHRITVTPVTNGKADMAFGDAGNRVFQEIDGSEVRLDIRTESEEARRFLDWLRSAPGKAAIESFERDGQPVYTTDSATVVAEKTETFDGDKAIGARLAIVHCGRCHVVDDRNRMGGIGSTPSFAALRGRENWSDLFRAFWSENPHPSFTQVDGVTEPFDPNKAVHVAPVEITLHEIEAITAFVATLKPRELGRPVQSN
ncbi:MAG: cytochrome c [Silicimonas sp.]|jgi:mono/diheme cytochrome c family protein|nr:cytochrome c [Silicimonas sp.]